MSTINFIISILVATASGVAVGLERQRKNKSAGLRTNTLVALGACIFVLIGVFATEEAGDPSRVIGQVASGMGFLGAGVIFRHGINVQGLTTAATLQCSAALGCLSGLGFYLYAGICAVLVIIINMSFKITDRLTIGERKKKKEKKISNDLFE